MREHIDSESLSGDDLLFKPIRRSKLGTEHHRARKLAGIAMVYTIRDHRHTFAVTAAKEMPLFVPRPLQGRKPPRALKSGATMGNRTVPDPWFQFGCLIPNRRPRPTLQKEGSPEGDWYCTKLSTAKVRLTAYHSRMEASHRLPLSSSEASLFTFP